MVGHHTDGHQEILPGSLHAGRVDLQLRGLRRGLLSVHGGEVRPSDECVDLLPRHEHPETLLQDRRAGQRHLRPGRLRLQQLPVLSGAAGRAGGEVGGGALHDLPPVLLRGGRHGGHALLCGR